MTQNKFKNLTSQTILLTSLSLLAACSTARVDEIETKTSNIKDSIDELRNIQAEQKDDIQSLKGEIKNLRGQLEELNHNYAGKAEAIAKSIEQFESRMPPPEGVPQDLLAKDEQSISKLNSSAAESYKQNLKLLRSGNFSSAASGFLNFFTENSQTAYSDNALFWQGICYMQLGQFDKAISSFNEVMQKFPAEDMVAPSLYYLGESFMSMGSQQNAVLSFQKLVDDHKNSSYTQRARERVKELSPKSSGTTGRSSRKK